MAFDITGTYNLKTPPATAWALLNDVKVLQTCIPGCKSLTETGPDEYEAELMVGVGPVRGVYKGTVKITERKPPQSYRMTVKGSGGAGFVQGDGVLTLSSNGSGGTTVSVKGTAEAGGLLARVGHRFIDGAATQLTRKFFECLAKRAAAG